MSKVFLLDDRLVIKANKTSVFVSIVCAAMMFSGIRLLVGLLLAEGKMTPVDFLGCGFISVWIALVLWAGICSVADGSKQVIITADGIDCKVLSASQSIQWSQVQDWGLSYNGMIRGGGIVYELYFSDHACELRNYRSKKLKGSMIKTFVFDDDYVEIINKVIPFCQEKTTITPFICKDRYQLLRR